jgi:hypothetical protein
VRSLVTEEMGLGQMIENAFKLLKEEQESIQIAGENGTDEEDIDLFDYDKDIVEVTDSDFAALRELEDEAAEADESYLNSFLEEE